MAGIVSSSNLVLTPPNEQLVNKAVGLAGLHTPLLSPGTASAGVTEPPPLTVTPVQEVNKLVPCTDPLPKGTEAETLALVLINMPPEKERNSLIPPWSPTVGLEASTTGLNELFAPVRDRKSTRLNSSH